MAATPLPSDETSSRIEELQDSGMSRDKPDRSLPVLDTTFAFPNEAYQVERPTTPTNLEDPRAFLTKLTGLQPWQLEAFPDELPPLPISRPTSPLLHTPEPSRSPLSERRLSSTSVPIRFRRPPGSPGTTRDDLRPDSKNAPSPSSSPLRPPGPRHAKTHSGEFVHSREYRPLYLVERNRKSAELEEEVLPALPSSGSPSRASSTSGTEEEYQSAYESAHGSPSASVSDAFEDALADPFQFVPPLYSGSGPEVQHLELADREMEELTESQQTTPKASSFPAGVLDVRRDEVALPAEDLSARLEQIQQGEARGLGLSMGEPVATHSTLSSRVHDQFPGQNIAHFAAPYLPRGPVQTIPLAPSAPIDDVQARDMPMTRSRDPSPHKSSSRLQDAALGALVGGATAAVLHHRALSPVVSEDDFMDGSPDPDTIDSAAPLPATSEPERPLLERALSGSKKSKKSKKGSKGKSIDLGNEVPKELTAEDYAKMREADAADAVDGWFSAPVQEPKVVEERQEKKPEEVKQPEPSPELLRRESKGKGKAKKKKGKKGSVSEAVEAQTPTEEPSQPSLPDAAQSVEEPSLSSSPRDVSEPYLPSSSKHVPAQDTGYIPGSSSSYLPTFNDNEDAWDRPTGEDDATLVGEPGAGASPEMLSKEFRRQKLLDHTAPKGNDEIAVQRAVIGYGDDSPLAREMLASKLGAFKEPEREESRLQLSAPTSIAIEPVEHEAECEVDSTPTKAVAEDATSASKSKKDKKKGKKGKRGGQIVDLEPAALPSEPDIRKDADAHLPAAPSIQEQLEHDVLQPAFNEEITPAEEPKPSTDTKPIYDAGDVSQYLITSSSNPSPPSESATLPSTSTAPSTTQEAKEVVSKTSDKKTKGKKEKINPTTPEGASGWGKGFLGALGWGKKKASTTEMKGAAKSPTEKGEVSTETIAAPVAEGAALEQTRSVKDTKSVYDAGDVAQYLVADSGAATPERVGTPAAGTSSKDAAPDETKPKISTSAEEVVPAPVIELSSKDAAPSEFETIAEPEPLASSIETAPEALSDNTLDISRELSISDDVQQPTEPVVSVDTEPAKSIEQPLVQEEIVSAEDKPVEDVATSVEQAEDEWAPTPNKAKKKKAKKAKAGESEPAVAEAEPITSGTPVELELPSTDKPIEESITRKVEPEAKQAEVISAAQNQPMENVTLVEDDVRAEQGLVEEVPAPVEQPIEEAPLSKKDKKKAKKAAKRGSVGGREPSVTPRESVTESTSSDASKHAEELDAPAELRQTEPEIVSVGQPVEEASTPVQLDAQLSSKGRPADDVSTPVQEEVEDEWAEKKEKVRKGKQAVAEPSVLGPTEGQKESSVLADNTARELATLDSPAHQDKAEVITKPHAIAEEKPAEEYTLPMDAPIEDASAPVQTAIEEESAPVFKKDKKKAAKRGSVIGIESSTTEAVGEAEAKLPGEDTTVEATVTTEDKPVEDVPTPANALKDMPVGPTQVGPATATSDKPAEGVPTPENALLEDASAPAETTFEESAKPLSAKDKKKKKKGKKGQSVDVEPAATEAVDEAEAKISAEVAHVDPTIPTPHDQQQLKLLPEAAPIGSAESLRDQLAEESSPPAQVEPVAADALDQQQPEFVTAQPVEEPSVPPVTLVDDKAAEDQFTPVTTQPDDEPTTPLSKKAKKKKAKKGKSVDTDPIPAIPTAISESQAPTSDNQPPPSVAPKEQKETDVTAPLDSQKTLEPADISQIESSVHVLTATPDAPVHGEPVENSAEGEVSVEDDGDMPSKKDKKRKGKNSGVADVQPAALDVVAGKELEPPAEPLADVVEKAGDDSEDAPAGSVKTEKLPEVVQDDEWAAPLSKKEKKKKGKKGKTSEPSTPAVDEPADPLAEAGAPIAIEQVVEPTLPELVQESGSRDVSEPTESVPSPAIEAPAEEIAPAASSKKSKKKKGKQGSINQGVEPEVPSTPITEEQVVGKSAAREVVEEAVQPAEIITPIEQSNVKSSEPTEDGPLVDEQPTSKVADTFDDNTTSQPSEPVDEEVVVPSKKEKKKKGKKGKSASGTVTPAVTDAELETRDIAVGNNGTEPVASTGVDAAFQEASAKTDAQATPSHFPVANEPIAEPEIRPTPSDLPADDKIQPAVDEAVAEREPTTPLSKKDKKKAKKAKKGASETETPPAPTPSGVIPPLVEQPILDTPIVSEPQDIAQPEDSLQQVSTPVDQLSSEPQAEQPSVEPEQDLDDSTMSKKEKKKKKKSKSISILESEPVTPLQEIPEPVLEEQTSEPKNEVPSAESELVQNDQAPEKKLESQVLETPAPEPSKSVWIDYVPPPPPEKETATQRKRRLKREQQEKEKWDEEQRERIAQEERRAAEAAEIARTAAVPEQPTPEVPFEEANELQVIDQPAEPTPTFAATPAEPSTYPPLPIDDTQDAKSTPAPNVEKPAVESIQEEAQEAPLSKKDKKTKKSKRASIVEESEPSTPALPEEQAKEVPSDELLPVVSQPETDFQAEREPAPSALDVEKSETIPPIPPADEIRNEAQDPVLNAAKEEPVQDDSVTVPLSKKDKKKAKKAKRGSAVNSEASTTPATPIEEAKDPLLNDPPPPPDPDPPAQETPAPETPALEEVSVESEQVQPTALLSNKDKKQAKKAKGGFVVEEMPAASQDDAFLASETGERLVGDAERHEGGAADTIQPELAVERSLEAPIAEAHASVNAERKMGPEGIAAELESSTSPERTVDSSRPDDPKQTSDENLSTSAPKGFEEPPAETSSSSVPETPQEPTEDERASTSTKKGTKSKKRNKRELIAEEATPKPLPQTDVISTDVPTSSSPVEPITEPASSSLPEPGIGTTEEIEKDRQVEPCKTATAPPEEPVNVEQESISSSKKKGKKAKRASTIQEPTPEVPTAEPASEQVTEQQIVEEPSAIVPDALHSTIPELSEEAQLQESAQVTKPTHLDIAQSSRDIVPEDDKLNDVDDSIVPVSTQPMSSESQVVEESVLPTKLSKKDKKKAKKSKDQSGTTHAIPELAPEIQPEPVVEPTAAPIEEITQLGDAVEPVVETAAVSNEEFPTHDTQEQLQQSVEDESTGLSKKDKKKTKKAKARQSGTATDDAPEMAVEVEQAAAVEEMITATIEEQPTIVTAKAPADSVTDSKVPELQSEEVGQDLALSTSVLPEVTPTPAPAGATDRAAPPETVEHTAAPSPNEAEKSTEDESSSMSKKAKKKAKKGKGKLSEPATPVVEQPPQLEAQEKDSSSRTEIPAEEPLTAAPSAPVEDRTEIVPEVPLDQAPSEPTPDTVEKDVLASDFPEQPSSTSTAPVTEVQAEDELAGLSKKSKKKAKKGKGKVSDQSTPVIENIPEVPTDSPRDVASIVPEAADVAVTHEPVSVPAAVVINTSEDVHSISAPVVQDYNVTEPIAQPAPEQEENAVDERAPIPAKNKGKKSKNSSTVTPVVEPLAEEVSEVKEKLPEDVAIADALPAIEDPAVSSVEIAEFRAVPEDSKIDKAQVVSVPEIKPEEADVDEWDAKKKKGRKGKNSGTATPIPEAVVERQAEKQIAPEEPIKERAIIDENKEISQEFLVQEAAIEQPTPTGGAESQAEQVPEPQPEARIEQPIQESKDSEGTQSTIGTVAEPEDERATPMSKKKGKKNKRKASLATPVTEERSLPPTEHEVPTQQDLATAVVQEEYPKTTESEASTKQDLGIPVIEAAEPTRIESEASVQQDTAQTAVEDVTEPISVSPAEPEVPAVPAPSEIPSDFEDERATASKKKGKKGKSKDSEPQTPIAEILEPVLDDVEVAPRFPAALHPIDANKTVEPSPADAPAKPSTETVEAEKPVLEPKLSKKEKKAKKTAAASTLDVEPIVEITAPLEEPTPELTQDPVQEPITESLPTHQTVDEFRTPEIDVTLSGVAGQLQVKTSQTFDHPPAEVSLLPSVESQIINTATGHIAESSDPEPKDVEAEDEWASFVPKKGKKEKKSKKAKNVEDGEPQTANPIDIAREVTSESLVEPMPSKPTAASDLRNEASSLPISSQSPNSKHDAVEEPIAEPTHVEDAPTPTHEMPQQPGLDLKPSQEPDAVLAQAEIPREPDVEDERAPVSRKPSKKDKKKGNKAKDKAPEIPQETAESTVPTTTATMQQAKPSAPVLEPRLEPAVETSSIETDVEMLPAQLDVEASSIKHTPQPAAIADLPEDAPKEAQDDEWALPAKKSKKDKKKGKKSKSTSEAATPVAEEEVELLSKSTAVDVPTALVQEELQHEEQLPPAEQTTNVPLPEHLVEDVLAKASATSAVEQPIIESQSHHAQDAMLETSTTTTDPTADLAGSIPLSPSLQAIQDEVADLKQRSETLDRQLSVDDVPEASTPVTTSMFDVISKLGKKDKKKSKKDKATTLETSESSTPAEPESIQDTKETISEPVQEEDVPALSRKQSKKDKKKAKAAAFSWDESTEKSTSIPAADPVETITEHPVEQMEQHNVVQNPIHSTPAVAQETDVTAPVESTREPVVTPMEPPEPIVNDLPALSRKLSKKDKKKAKQAGFAWEEPTGESLAPIPSPNDNDVVTQVTEPVAVPEVIMIEEPSKVPDTIDEAPHLVPKLSKKDKNTKQQAMSWDEPSSEAVDLIPALQDCDVSAAEPKVIATDPIVHTEEILPPTAPEVDEPKEDPAPLSRKLSKKEKKKAKTAAVAWDDSAAESSKPTLLTDNREVSPASTGLQPTTTQQEVPVTSDSAPAEPATTLPGPITASEMAPIIHEAPLALPLTTSPSTIGEKTIVMPVFDDAPAVAPALTRKQSKKDKKKKGKAPAFEFSEPATPIEESSTKIKPEERSPLRIDDFAAPVSSKDEKPGEKMASSFDREEPTNSEGLPLRQDDKLTEQSVEIHDAVAAEPAVGFPTKHLSDEDTTTEPSIALADGSRGPTSSSTEHISSRFEEQVRAAIDESSTVHEPGADDEWALPIKKSKKEKRKSKKIEATLDDEPTQVVEPISEAVDVPAIEATPVIDLPNTTSSRDVNITESVPGPTVELSQSSSSSQAAKKKNKKHKLAGMFEPATLEETVASKTGTSKVQEETARDIPEVLPEAIQLKQSDAPGAFADEPRAKSLDHNIDFAATVAAGLKESGFDTDLVLNDPAFHRTTSPQGVRDIVPDDDIAAARHGASKSRFSNLGRSPSPTSPEAGVPTVKEAPQPIVAVASESAPTFDPMDILNDPTFAQRKSPPGVLEEADPDELWSSEKKGKKAKGKKKRASLAQDGSTFEAPTAEHIAVETTAEPIIEKPPHTPSAISTTELTGARQTQDDELSRDRAIPKATMETTDDFWDEQLKKKGKQGKPASKRADNTEAVHESGILSGAITPFEEDFQRPRSVNDPMDSKSIVEKDELALDKGSGKKSKKEKRSVLPETMVAAAGAAALAAIVSDKEERKSKEMELPPTFDQVPKSLGGVEPNEYPFPALPTPEERTGFSIQGKHAKEVEAEDEWASPVKKKGKKDKKSRGKDSGEKDNEFFERSLGDTPSKKGRHVSQSDPFNLPSANLRLEQEGAGHTSPNHKRREHPVSPEAEPEEKRVHLSGPSQHDLSFPEDPSSLTSSHTREPAHATAERSGLDSPAHSTDARGHSPIVEPTWSFGDVRDSGVHVADSPTVHDAPQLPAYSDVRDSGYHDTSFETPRKSKASRQLFVEADGNKEPHSKEPVTPYRSRGLEDYDAVPSPSPPLPELPSLTTITSPNAIDSATRERSSYLFDSSPSTRQYGESSPAASKPRSDDIATIGAATIGAAAVVAATSAQSSRGSPRHEKHASLQSHRKHASPEREVKQKEPSRSIFGDPTEKKPEQVRKLSTPSNKHMRTPSSILDPIKEASPDDSPLLKKHALEVSDAGLPDRDVKSARRSQSPKSFSERMKSPPPVTPTPASRKNVPSKIDTSPPVQRKGSPWQQVHESVDRTMTLSPARRLPHDHSPSTTDPIKVRIAEQRSPSVFSDRSVNMRSPDADRPLSALSNHSTSSLRRVDRSRSGDLRSAAKIREARAHDAKSQSNLAGIALAAGATAAIAASIASSSKYDPVKDKGKGRAEMPDVYVS